MTEFVRDALLREMDRHLPALEYLAHVEANERRRADINGVRSEIRELERVLAGEFSDTTKAYCRTALQNMRGLLATKEAYL